MVRLLLVAGSSLYFAFALDPCAVDSGGDGGGSTKETIGAQCSSIITEWCQQGINRCALAYTESECESSDASQCCSSSTCSQTSTSSQSDVDTCKADIDTIDCNFIVNSTLPPSCQGLLHP